MKYPFTNGLDVVTASWGENKNGAISTIMETAELKVLSSVKCIEKLNTLQVPVNSLHIKYICTVADPYIIMCGVSMNFIIQNTNKRHYRLQNNYYILV